MQLKGTSILVTGGSGFIGSALVKELDRLGAQVHGVSRNKADALPAVSWHFGDLSDLSFVEQLIESSKPDYVFHLAGHVVGKREVNQVMPTLKSNFLTTVNLLLSLNKYGCKRMILGGSLEEPSAGDENILPSSPYAASKFAASNYSLMFHELYGLPVAIARINMGYGPGMRDMNKLLPYLILSTHKGETPKLSSGSRQLDWIYVDDIVSGLIHMMLAKDIDGETIDLGTGKMTSIREISELTVSLINPGIAPEFGAIEDRPLEQESTTDIENTFNKTGWKSTTSLKEGLEKMIVSLVGEQALHE